MYIILILMIKVRKLFKFEVRLSFMVNFGLVCVMM